MANYSTEIAPLSLGSRAGDALVRFFAGAGNFLAAVGNARARTAEFERLNAKTDAQLAEMGLKREDIPRHVFRDLFYV